MLIYYVPSPMLNTKNKGIDEAQLKQSLLSRSSVSCKHKVP